MKPLVTVLTMVHNGLPHLKEAIESTLSQTYTDFEYLLIDDASTDNSAECILGYKDQRIRFMQNKKNQHVSSTFNKAFSTINTRYVVRLDQDDVSLPNRLMEQIDYLEKHSDISVISSWEIIINSQGEKIRNVRGKINNYGDFLGNVLLGLSPIWHPSLAFRKKDMDSLGGFKTGYEMAEDFEVTSNFALRRFNAAIVPSYHLLVRYHTASHSAKDFEGQAVVMRKIHNETISKFSKVENFECLSSLLRLEKDPCGRRYNKIHMLNLTQELDNLILNVSNKQNLKQDELKSLKKVIYKRVGLGVQYAKLLSWIPTLLYYPLFYSLSPQLKPQIRVFFSKFYNKIQELRYILRLFKDLNKK